MRKTVTIRAVPFDPDALESVGALFPLDIEDDPWVAFHGTSSVYEESVDRNGLTSRIGPATKEEVGLVVSLYENLNWAGRSTGGYAVLKPFSFDHDFADPRGKPLYLAESSFRAATFAMREFAGGECARALRHSIDDLHAYHTDADLRRKNLQRLARLQQDLAADMGRDLLRPPDLDRLGRGLAAIEGLRSRCNDFLESHTHGVIYAIRFDPSQLEKLEFHEAMGLKIWTEISPRQIVAKLRLPRDWEPVGNLRAAYERAQEEPLALGLISALRSRRAEK